MSRYVISDHHFGHANIIEYCDRPFSSPAEMDTTMLNRHFETVSSDDVVIHLGDIAMDMQDGRETVERMEAINGDLLVQGNHDVGLSDGQAPVPVVDSCILSHGEYVFYCTHIPEHVPDDWDGWVLHGHHHNNNLEQYPLIAYDQQRVNVGVELLDYRPISLSTLTSILDECTPGSHLTDIEAVENAL